MNQNEKFDERPVVIGWLLLLWCAVWGIVDMAERVIRFVIAAAQ